MTNYISGMPFWAIILFVLTFLYTLTFIAKPAKQAALDAGMSMNKARNIYFGIFGFYVIYLGYVSYFSIKGAFDVNSLVPKVMVWAGFPLLIILFGFIGNTKLFKELLRSVKLESLVAIHIFRLEGAIFVLMYLYHRLPGPFGLSAGIGDMLTALFAILVVRMIAKNHPWRITAVYVWNIFGILDIATLLTIAVIDAMHANAAGIVHGDLEEMTTFPFVWFPAFAPATIWFLHTAVFRKLYQLKKAAVNN